MQPLQYGKGVAAKYYCYIHMKWSWEAGAAERTAAFAAAAADIQCT